MVAVFRQVTANCWWLAFTYAFVLFNPAAFDDQIGTRLYRNSIFAPAYFLAFGLMLFVLLRLLKGNPTRRWLVTINILLGLVFTFSYYLNEAGMWLVPCLVVSHLVCLIVYIRRSHPFLGGCGADRSNWLAYFNNLPRLRVVASCLIFAIPFGIFGSITLAYREVNQTFFGVRVIETRTQGELGIFAENVYQIYSDNRTDTVWAPPDAVDAAFAASATLRSIPNLQAELDAQYVPILGDFLPWRLRWGLTNTGNWTSEPELQLLFAQVNAELADAFRSGQLGRDARFQLVSSAGGRNLAEIERLIAPTLNTYRVFLTLTDFAPGGQPSAPDSNRDLAFISDLTNFPLTPSNTTDPETGFQSGELRALNWHIGNSAVNTIFALYRIVYPTLMTFACLGIIGAFIPIKHTFDGRQLSRVGIALTAIVLMGISALYAFGIAWFAEFLWVHGDPASQNVIQKYYATGMVPLLALFILLGSYLFFDFIRRLRIPRAT